METEIETERLRLRRWDESDREPFAERNADPLVMEYFTSTRTRAESDDLIDRIEAHFDRAGFGLWAVEVAASGEFAGYVGLWPTTRTRRDRFIHLRHESQVAPCDGKARNDPGPIR